MERGEIEEQEEFFFSGEDFLERCCDRERIAGAGWKGGKWVAGEGYSSGFLFSFLGFSIFIFT